MSRSQKWVTGVLVLAGLMATNSVSAKTVTIHWGAARNPTKTNETLIKMFEKQNPSIKVKMTNYVWDWQAKVLTAIAGGVAPDVVQGWAGPWRSFIDRNLLLPVDPYIKEAKYSLAPFSKELLNCWRKGGKLYSLPMYTWTSATQYNATLFNRGGVPLPTSKWTWDDYLQAARKLTLKDPSGKIKQFGTVLRWSMGTDLPIWIKSNGGNVTPPDQIVANKLVVDQPKAVEAVQFVYDMMYKSHVAPTPSEIVGLDYTMVSTGKAAFWLGGSHDLGYYNVKNATYQYGVAEPPTGKAGKASIFPQDAFGVLRSSKHPNEAMKFVMFLAGPEATALRASTDEYLPPARRDAFEPWIKNHPLAKKGINLSAYRETFEYAFPCPQYANDQIVTQKLTPVLDQIFIKNSISVKDGLTSACKAVNTQLQKYKAITD